MHQELSLFLKSLGKPGYGETMAQAGRVPLLPVLSGLIDINHSIVLRGILDSLPREGGRAVAVEVTGALDTAEKRFNWLCGENRKRFAEFRERWGKRLRYSMLAPMLLRDEWLVPEGDGCRLARKGTPKELKSLYMQSLHDMVADCERQLAAIAGHIGHLQSALAAHWHREAISDNSSRLLPALEAGMRAGELEVFRDVRAALAPMSLGRFTQGFPRWEAGLYPTERAAFLRAAWPWYRPWMNDNGFEGFMQELAGLTESVGGKMIGYYQEKWRLLLGTPSHAV